MISWSVLATLAAAPPGLPVARVAAALAFVGVLGGLLFALGRARQRAQQAEVNLELEAEFRRLEREFEPIAVRAPLGNPPKES